MPGLKKEDASCSNGMLAVKSTVSFSKNQLVLSM